MTTSHTPTPWRNGDKYGEDIFSGVDRIAVATEHPYRPGEAIVAVANAAHIVRCVNAHDDLVAALKALEDCYCEASEHLDRDQRAHHREVLMQARAALVKATQ
jgi:hypothetical protein